MRFFLCFQKSFILFFGIVSALYKLPNKQRRAIHLITQQQSSVNSVCIKKPYMRYKMKDLDESIQLSLKQVSNSPKLSARGFFSVSHFYSYLSRESKNLPS